jgi:hypothetical protein
MEYIIPCRSLFDKSDINIQDNNKVVIANIHFQKEYYCSVYHIATQKTYIVESNPLRFKQRFLIFDQDKNKIANIAVGKNILHSIIEREQYYFVKSAFFKIRYKVYKERNVITRLVVAKEDKKRIYKITSVNDDFINVIALFLLAEAVRIKSILI